MRATFAYGLKGTVAATLLSCFIAGGVCAMTSPAVTANDPAVSVNRTNKGDRLPQTPLPHRQLQNFPSTGSSPTATKRTPLGCDPAFSPVVEPARAHIFKRCMV